MHTYVRTRDLPAPVGPYSPAVAFERLVFVSGQGATDPATGQIVAGDVEAQTTQCLKNVEAILKAAGSTLQRVLRCGVFLVDIRDFAKMNAAYARMFGDHRPARTTVQVAALGPVTFTQTSEGARVAFLNPNQVVFPLTLMLPPRHPFMLPGAWLASGSIRPAAPTAAPSTPRS